MIVRHVFIILTIWWIFICNLTSIYRHVIGPYIICLWDHDKYSNPWSNHWNMHTQKKIIIRNFGSLFLSLSIRKFLPPSPISTATTSFSPVDPTFPSSIVGLPNSTSPSRFALSGHRRRNWHLWRKSDAKESVEGGRASPKPRKSAKLGSRRIIRRRLSWAKEGRLSCDRDATEGLAMIDKRCKGSMEGRKASPKLRSLSKQMMVVGSVYMARGFCIMERGRERRCI